MVILCNTYLFSQKDSTLVRDNFYLELNGGVGSLTYIESYGNKGVYYLMDNEKFSYNLSVNFFYKNNWILTGLSAQSLITKDHFLKSLSYMLSLNLLFKDKSQRNFLGPFFSYGYISDSHEVFPRFCIGLTTHVKHMHVAVKYDWFKRDPDNYSDYDNFIDAENIYLEIGYAFNLESFRKKK